MSIGKVWESQEEFRTEISKFVDETVLMLEQRKEDISIVLENLDNMSASDLGVLRTLTTILADMLGETKVAADNAIETINNKIQSIEV